MVEIDDLDVAGSIALVPVWRHRIPIGGLVTPGTEDSDGELRRLQIDLDLSGKRVLDVGCSDGRYSFECESRGADEVVAMDDESSLLAGGGNGFQVAKRLLDSRVEYRVASVEDLSVEEFGQFDRILFVNVLYHLRNPVAALERLFSVTRPGGEMILKTYYRTDVRKFVKGRCVGFDIDPRPKFWFFPSTELAGDPTNWFAPNRRALEGLLHATGWEFSFQLRWQDRLYYRCTRP